MKFYGVELASGTEVQNLTAERVTAFPIVTATDKGRIVFYNTDGCLKVWDGNSWNSIATDLSSSNMVTSFKSPNLPTPRTGAVVLQAADLVSIINSTNLPIASPDVRGGVKVGTTLTMAGDVLNVATATVIPSGTHMAFYETTSPVGWTPVTLGNTYGIRFVNTGTTGQSGGGSDDPIKNDSIVSHTHTYSGTSDYTNVDHTHTVYMNVGSMYNPPSSGGLQVGQAASSGEPRAWTGGASANGTNHAHHYSGTTVGPAGAPVGTWTPRYLDFIVCRKS